MTNGIEQGEILRPQEFAGLHARLLLTGEALNPGKTDLPAVTREALGAFEQRDYSPYEQPSLRERTNYWQGKEDNAFDRQKQTWITNTASLFTNSKAFFTESGKGRQWSAVFTRLGIDAANFSEPEAEALYNKYFTGEAAHNPVKTFVRDALNGYQATDLPAIEWLANIFGHNSSEVVRHLVEAEAQLLAQPADIVSQANENSRLNNLNDGEKRILTFLWPNGQPQAATETAKKAAMQQPQQETTPTEANLQNIIEGKGFAEIERVGWKAYREALTKVSYSQIIAAKLSAIEQAAALPDTLPEAELVRLNKEAIAKVDELTQRLPQEYPKNGSEPFSAFITTSGKLAIRGKDITNLKQLTHLTRIYFDVYTRTAPDAFLSLFEALKTEGALNALDLSLNLENFGPGLEKSISDTNSIIVYIPNQPPTTMEKIARAVRKAKAVHPQYWRMSPRDQAMAQSSLLREFKIPLDETTGFVEMPNNHSYDTTHRGAIQKELLGSGLFNLRDIYKKFLPFSPQRPGLFSDDAKKWLGMSRRRIYMPGILFDEAAAPTPAQSPTLETPSQAPPEQIVPNVNLGENIRTADQYIRTLRDPARYRENTDGDTRYLLHEFGFTLTKPVENAWFPASLVDIFESRYKLPLALYIAGNHANLVLTPPYEDTDGQWKIKVYDPMNPGEHERILPNYGREGVDYSALPEPYRTRRRLQDNNIHANQLATAAIAQNQYDISLSKNPQIQPHIDAFMRGKLAALQQDAKNCIPYCHFVGALLNALKSGETDFKKVGIPQFAQDFGIRIKTLEEILGENS